MNPNPNPSAAAQVEVDLDKAFREDVKIWIRARNVRVLSARLTVFGWMVGLACLLTGIRAEVVEPGEPDGTNVR